MDTGRYECPECTDRFDSVGDKKRHLRDTHQIAKNT
jgi:hypothetical protein